MILMQQKDALLLTTIAACDRRVARGDIFGECPSSPLGWKIYLTMQLTALKINQSRPIVICYFHK